MIIFQPDRHLLNEEVKEVGKYITGRVLDVGAGEVNRYAGHFRYSEYLRMDPYQGDRVDIVGSADAIPEPDGSFDSVVCTQVFEHLEFPEKSAKEIYRVLKPGGHLLVTVPQMNELHEEPRDYWRYTKFGLESLFGHAGFKTIHQSQRGGFFATLAQMRIRYVIDRFQLYRRPILLSIFSPFLSLCGRVSLLLDRIDKSQANRKHAIGWCFVFRK
jgi:SAM-dependent methyltransferase